MDQCPVKSGSECEQEIRNITQKPRKETENKKKVGIIKRNKTFAEIGTKPPLAGIADAPAVGAWWTREKATQLPVHLPCQEGPRDFGDRLAISCLSRI